MKNPPLGMGREIIQAETNDGRFERLCVELVSHLEGGAPVLSTSASYDLGRDGKTIRGDSVFVCCSLNDKPDAKALKDFKRLAATTAHVKRVYFCSSQSLSEYRREEIKKDISPLASAGSTIEVLGATELAEYDVRFVEGHGESSVIAAHYPAEVEDCFSRLLERGDAEPADVALRTALIAFGPTTSDQIRRSVYRALLLETLAVASQPLTKVEIGKAISDRLRLGRSIRADALSPFLDELIGQDWATEIDGKVQLTGSGRSGMTDLKDSHASGVLLKGRTAVRKKLEQLLQEELRDSEFARIWEKVESGLAALFYARGEALVNAASALMETDGASQAVQDLADEIRELADKATADVVNKERRAQMSTAVVDAFTEPGGAACEWLVQICAAFVAVCAAGLESQTAAALRRTLRRIELVFDTDVVLTLLCEGESLHEAVERSTRTWRAEGGKLLNARPVLHEVAYHAWISEHDFADVKSWLPGTEEEAQRLISNAFVRAFSAMLRSQRARLREWSSFIGQFKGRASDDVENVEKHLRSACTEDRLPSVSPDQEEIATRLSAVLNEQIQAADLDVHERRRREDKARRDVELVASISHRRSVLRGSGGGGTCCLVSSSGRLRELPSLLSTGSNEPPWAISIATWTYLLSMLPGASLGLPALKSFLFSAPPAATRMPEIQRASLRALKQAGELGFGWSKRVTLQEKLQQAVFDTARAMDRPVREVAEMLVSPSAETAETAAGVLSQALEQIPAPRRVERELEEARKRIQDLETELKKLRER